MATRKAAEPEVKAEVEVTTAETVPETAEAENTPETAKDPWTVNVEMLVPRRKPGEAEEYYVCVNDRRFYIPRNGKRQSLPQPIAEALQNSLEAEAEADAYSEQITESAMTQPKA